MSISSIAGISGIFLAENAAIVPEIIEKLMQNAVKRDQFAGVKKKKAANLFNLYFKNCENKILNEVKNIANIKGI